MKTKAQMRAKGTPLALIYLGVKASVDTVKDKKLVLVELRIRSDTRQRTEHLTTCEIIALMDP